MPTLLRRQAERFFQVFTELVRGYQFRDREGIACHGVSVSQCYTLDALGRQGPMTMGELSGHLYLELSTMTRIVDDLVAEKLAARTPDVNDRRVCRVKLTRKGKSLVARIRNDLIGEHELMLREIAPEGRDAVIAAMSYLLSAFKERTGVPAGAQRRPAQCGPQGRKTGAKESKELGS